MMTFCLRLKIYSDRANAFHLWLIMSGKRIGITSTGMINDSADVDLKNPDFQIYSFVCQAAAELKSEQLVTLFTECERIGALVLGIVYRETTLSDDDDDETGWNKLLNAVRRTTDPPIVVHRLRRDIPFRTQLRVIPGGLCDDPDK